LDEVEKAKAKWDGMETKAKEKKGDYRAAA
jgi:hypothetical protein